MAATPGVGGADGRRRGLRSSREVRAAGITEAEIRGALGGSVGCSGAGAAPRHEVSAVPPLLLGRDCATNSDGGGHARCDQEGQPSARPILVPPVDAGGGAGNAATSSVGGGCAGRRRRNDGAGDVGGGATATGCVTGAAGATGGSTEWHKASSDILCCRTTAVNAGIVSSFPAIKAVTRSTVAAATTKGSVSRGAVTAATGAERGKQSNGKGSSGTAAPSWRGTKRLSNEDRATSGQGSTASGSERRVSAFVAGLTPTNSTGTRSSFSSSSGMSASVSHMTAAASRLSCSSRASSSEKSSTTMPNKVLTNITAQSSSSCTSSALAALTQTSCSLGGTFVGFSAPAQGVTSMAHCCCLGAAPPAPPQRGSRERERGPTEREGTRGPRPAQRRPDDWFRGTPGGLVMDWHWCWPCLLAKLDDWPPHPWRDSRIRRLPGHPVAPAQL